MTPTVPGVSRRYVAVVLPLLFIALADHAALAATDIGKATSITTSVTDTMAALKTGDAIFQNQTIVTDASGVGQFEFRDKTRLAIGPGSIVVLDNFVYDSATSQGSVVINLTAGALRFVTGTANHDAYTIVTPAATIGVRGTVFDVYADRNGEMAIAMIDGAVEVCPRLRPCRSHNVVGRFLHMTPTGLFSLRDKWDGTFLAGVPFALALPFLNDQRTLLPSLRGKTATIRRYVGSTVRSL
ncbi:MAG: FecR domain-containing protein, partial [Bauldia sp.]|nr:FecR domain-containing protein [Bauldia sp.]